MQPTIGEASVEICIGQVRSSLIASIEDDFILVIDLISGDGLTTDPVKEALRLGNKEFKLNQCCTEAKSARLIAYQNCKHCDEVEQSKAQEDNSRRR